MPEKTIALVGSSPVYNADLGLDYVCTCVAGIPDATPSSFAQSCEAQAKNMGVSIINCPKVSVETGESGFVLNDGKSTHNVDILIADTDLFRLGRNEKLFLVKEEMVCNEAIEVAGAGCRIAFKVKEAYK